MNELALFAGIGGGILGGILNGWRTVCAVEIEPYCQDVLLQRQRDGMLKPFPIWGDITTFDGRPWRGCVDIVTGGFPCQDISAAGKGAGITGERSGLWSEMARVVREVRPRYVLVENSPMLTLRGLGAVLGELAAMGFDAEWGVLGADDAGAPHERERIWILGHALRDGCEADNGRQSVPDQNRNSAPHATRWQEFKQGTFCASEMVNTYGSRCQEQRKPDPEREEFPTAERSDWWCSEPAVGRVANGVAHRVDRLSAIGNGQVPAVVRLAWETLTYRRDDDRMNGAKPDDNYTDAKKPVPEGKAPSSVKVTR